MTDKTSLPSRLRKHSDWWLCAALVFALVYAAVIAFMSGGLSIHWDEVNHLIGPLQLTRGQIQEYIAVNLYYPPLYNLVTAAYFFVAGASVFTARLVSLTFTVLLIVLVYVTAKDMYSPKVGFAASVFFGVMPGIVWLSSVALVETMLIFLVTFSLVLFFRWLQTGRRLDLALGLATFALGVVAKYQTLVVVPLVILAGLLVLGKRGAVKAEVSGFMHSKTVWLMVPLAIGAGVAVIAFYVSGLLGEWLYSAQFGNVGQNEYSLRFPAPVFYLVEMVWPFTDSHPVSLVLYLLGLAGLVFFAVRRKPQDKYLLVWFLVTYVVFTLIPNRQWRYVSLVFPVLAVAAAEFAASVYGKAQKTWQSKLAGSSKRWLAKLSAAVLIAITVGGVAYSVADAYVWVRNDQIPVPIAEAAAYITSEAPLNGSVLVLCPFNRLSKDIAWFYLNSKTGNPIPVYQYPTLAVDAYPLDFNTTLLVSFCQTNGTRYVLLYEYEGTPTYYGSPLNEQAVYSMLNNTGRFTLQATFGETPRRMYVFLFNSQS